MTTEKLPMMCPECGVTMNHHADKVKHGPAGEEPLVGDTTSGEVVEEHHTCPECGISQCRTGEMV